MATPALIVVITVAVASVLAVVAVTLVLVGRLKEFGRRLSAVSDRLGPQLDLLSREAEVAQRELDRLSAGRDAGGYNGSERRTLSGPGGYAG